MTLTQLVGQRFCVGFDGITVPDSFRSFVRRTQIGSVILFTRNVGTAAQTHALCEELQRIFMEETGRPGLIMADQEGGIVKRLGADAALAPGAMALSAAGGGDIRTASAITGRELAAVGINMNLAPVADVNSNPVNPVIGVRSFGDQPGEVGKACAETVLGLHDAGVFTCAKHFPGHGDTALDSHLDLPLVDRSLADMEQQELVPFRAAIAAGTDAVMTTHILFPQLEKEKIPATMSRTIMTGLLRQQLGFQGLIVSDCMMMNAIMKFYGTVEGCLAAVKAGVDIVLVSHDMDLMLKAWEKVMAEAEAGNIDMREMEESAARVLRYRNMAPVFRGDLSLVGCEAHRSAFQDMMDRSVTRIGASLPAMNGRLLFAAPAPALGAKVSDSLDTDLTFAGRLTAAFGGEGITFPVDPSDEDVEGVLRRAQEADVICLGTVSALRHAGQKQLLEALMALGKPMIAVTLRDPYELRLLKPHVCGIAVWEFDAMSLSALERVLKGELSPAGRLPIRL